MIKNRPGYEQVKPGIWRKITNKNDDSSKIDMEEVYRELEQMRADFNPPPRKRFIKDNGPPAIRRSGIMRAIRLPEPESAEPHQHSTKVTETEEKNKFISSTPHPKQFDKNFFGNNISVLLSPITLENYKTMVSKRRSKDVAVTPRTSRSLDNLDPRGQNNRSQDSVILVGFSESSQSMSPRISRRDKLPNHTMTQTDTSQQRVEFKRNSSRIPETRESSLKSVNNKRSLSGPAKTHTNNQISPKSLSKSVGVVEKIANRSGGVEQHGAKTQTVVVFSKLRPNSSSRLGKSPTRSNSKHSIREEGSSSLNNRAVSPKNLRSSKSKNSVHDRSRSKTPKLIDTKVQTSKSTLSRSKSPKLNKSNRLVQKQHENLPAAEIGANTMLRLKTHRLISSEEDLPTKDTNQVALSPIGTVTSIVKKKNTLPSERPNRSHKTHELSVKKIVIESDDLSATDTTSVAKRGCERSTERNKRYLKRVQSSEKKSVVISYDSLSESETVSTNGRTRSKKEKKFGKNHKSVNRDIISIQKNAQESDDAFSETEPRKAAKSKSVKKHAIESDDSSSDTEPVNVAKTGRSKKVESFLKKDEIATQKKEATTTAVSPQDGQQGQSHETSVQTCCDVALSPITFPDPEPPATQLYKRNAAVTPKSTHSMAVDTISTQNMNLNVSPTTRFTSKPPEVIVQHCSVALSPMPLPQTGDKASFEPSRIVEGVRKSHANDVGPIVQDKNRIFEQLLESNSSSSGDGTRFIEVSKFYNGPNIFDSVQQADTIQELGNFSDSNDLFSNANEPWRFSHDMQLSTNVGYELKKFITSRYSTARISTARISTQQPIDEQLSEDEYEESPRDQQIDVRSRRKYVSSKTKKITRILTRPPIEEYLSENEIDESQHDQQIDVRSQRKYFSSNAKKATQISTRQPIDDQLFKDEIHDLRLEQQIDVGCQRKYIDKQTTSGKNTRAHTEHLWSEDRQEETCAGPEMRQPQRPGSPAIRARGRRSPICQEETSEYHNDRGRERELHTPENDLQRVMSERGRFVGFTFDPRCEISPSALTGELRQSHFCCKGRPHVDASDKGSLDDRAPDENYSYSGSPNRRERNDGEIELVHAFVRPSFKSRGQQAQKKQKHSLLNLDTENKLVKRQELDALFGEGANTKDAESNTSGDVMGDRAQRKIAQTDISTQTSAATTPRSPHKLTSPSRTKSPRHRTSPTRTSPVRRRSPAGNLLASYEASDLGTSVRQKSPLQHSESPDRKSPCPKTPAGLVPPWKPAGKKQVSDPTPPSQRQLRRRIDQANSPKRTQGTMRNNTSKIVVIPSKAGKTPTKKIVQLEDEACNTDGAADPLLERLSAVENTLTPQSNTANENEINSSKVQNKDRNNPERSPSRQGQHVRHNLFPFPTPNALQNSSLSPIRTRSSCVSTVRSQSKTQTTTLSRLPVSPKRTRTQDSFRVPASQNRTQTRSQSNCSDMAPPAVLPVRTQPRNRKKPGSPPPASPTRSSPPRNVQKTASAPVDQSRLEQALQDDLVSTSTNIELEPPTKKPVKKRANKRPASTINFQTETDDTVSSSTRSKRERRPPRNVNCINVEQIKKSLLDQLVSRKSSRVTTSAADSKKGRRKSSVLARTQSMKKARLSTKSTSKQPNRTQELETVHEEHSRTGPAEEPTSPIASSSSEREVAAVTLNPPENATKTPIASSSSEREVAAVTLNLPENATKTKRGKGRPRKKVKAVSSSEHESDERNQDEAENNVQIVIDRIDVLPRLSSEPLLYEVNQRVEEQELEFPSQYMGSQSVQSTNEKMPPPPKRTRGRAKKNYLSVPVNNGQKTSRDKGLRLVVSENAIDRKTTSNTRSSHRRTIQETARVQETTINNIARPFDKENEPPMGPSTSSGYISQMVTNNDNTDQNMMVLSALQMNMSQSQSDVANRGYSDAFGNFIKVASKFPAQFDHINNLEVNQTVQYPKDGVTTGYIRLREGMVKPLASSPYRSCIYYVSEGEAIVKFNDQEVLINKFGHIFIPSGTEYSIGNNYNGDLVMFYVRMERH